MTGRPKLVSGLKLQLREPTPYSLHTSRNRIQSFFLFVQILAKRKNGTGLVAIASEKVSE